MMLFVGDGRPGAVGPGYITVSAGTCSLTNLRGHGRFLQLLRLVVGPQSFDNVVDLPLHHSVELMQGEPDAVIGEAILWEIISADLLAAVSRADHLPPLLGNLFLLLLKLHFVEARTEHAL